MKELQALSVSDEMRLGAQLEFQVDISIADDIFPYVPK